MIWNSMWCGLMHEFFEITTAVAEADDGLAGRGLEQLDEILLVETRAHAAAATAGGGLDHDGKADFLGFLEGGLGIRHDVGAGRDGHAVGHRGGAGGGLVAHHRDDLGGGADERDVGGFADLGEARVFR